MATAAAATTASPRHTVNNQTLQDKHEAFRNRYVMAELRLDS